MRTRALAPSSFEGGAYSGVLTLEPLLGDQRGVNTHGAEISAAVAARVDSGPLRPRLGARHFQLEHVVTSLVGRHALSL